MTTETGKLKSAMNRNGLTERLRQAATVSDAGPGNGTGPAFHTVGSDGYLQRTGDQNTAQEKSDREIILELNEAIQEIIADSPLQLPEPQPSLPPASQPLIAQPIAQGVPREPMHGAYPPEPQVPPHAMHTGQRFQERMALPPPEPTQRVVDDGHLQDWLARQPDDQPEPRSRTRVAMISIGVMLLSILAGYGSAQLINSQRDANGQFGEWAGTPLNADVEGASKGLQINARDESDESRQDSIARLVNRVTTRPVPPASAASSDEPEKDLAEETQSPPTFRVASITGFSDAVPEPVPAQKEITPPAASKPSRSPETQEPATASLASTQTTIPGDEIESLFRRAEQLIADRDIAAARLVLRHLAESGSGPAAMKLAEAYDPIWLAENGAGGVPANNDLALRWYTMAHDRGEAGANARMEALNRAQRPVAE